MNAAQGSFYAALYEDLRLVEIWYYRRLLACFALIGVLCGILYLHVAAYKYTATLAVTNLPSQSQTDRLSSSLGASALASLVGVSGDSASPDFQLYLEAIYSNVVAEKLSHNNRLMHEVFADRWDPGNKSWRPPVGLVAALKNFARSLLGMPRAEWHPPGAAELQEYVALNVITTQEKGKKIVKITVMDTNRQRALHLLTSLSAAADGYVKSIALERADRYADYLVNALRSTTVQDVRQALIATLVEQEKTRMTANSNLSYAAQQLGPAYASPSPTSPKPVLVILGSLLLGTFVGALAVLQRFGWVDRADDWTRGRFRAFGLRARAHHQEHQSSPLRTD